MKRFIIFLISMIIVTTIGNASQNKKINIKVDDNTKTVVETAVIKNGRLYLPYSSFSSVLGLSAKRSSDGKKLELTYDKKVLQISGGEKTALLDGKKISMDTISEKSAVNFVSVKSVADAFSLGIKWDGKTRTLEIKTENNNKGEKPGLEYEVLYNGSYSSVGRKEEYFFPKEGFSIDMKQKGYEVIYQDGYSYVLISYGEKTTGGYSIDIIGVEKNKPDGFIVKTNLNIPSGNVTQAFTLPNALIKIKNPGKEKITVDMGQDTPILNQKLS